MAKNNAQACFDFALKHYNETVEIVKELSAIVMAVEPKFDFKIAMREYDFILQTILLQVAIEDGQFVENEKVFIDQITTYGDVLILLNKKAKESMPTWQDITWDSVGSLDQEHRQKLILIIVNYLGEFVKDFVGFFAIVDTHMKDRNFIEEIDDHLRAIILAMAMIDGDEVNLDDMNADSTREIVAGHNISRALLVDRWNEVIDEYKD